MKRVMLALLSAVLCVLLIHIDGVYAANYTYTYDSSGRVVEAVSSDSELSTHHYYDNNGNLTSKKLDKNLLLNGSFTRHNGITANNWTVIQSLNSKFEMIREEGQGEWSQKISAFGMQQPLFAGVSQDIRVMGGKPFTAKAQVRATALSGVKVQLWVDYLNAKNEYVGAFIDEMETVGGDYMTLSLRDTVPQTAVLAKYYVFIRSTTESGSGTFYITDASFAYGMDPNLLAHSSFENEPGWTGGSSNGWIKISRGNSIFEIVKEPGHGESAQMVTATNLQDSEYAGVSQDVKVVGGRQYTAKAQVRIVALKGAKVQLWVDYLNAKNEYVGANIQDVQVVGGDYMTLSLRGTIPASAVYARYYVFVRSTSSSGSGTFLVTDSSYAYGNDENLLAHGDFHQEADWTSDTSNGWKKIYTTDSKFEIIRNFTSGGGAQRVSVKNLKTPYYAGLSQDIKVSGGKKFKAETRVKVNALSGAKVHLWVDYLNENNEYVGTSIKEIESAGEEMTLSISNTIPATAAYARFYIFIRSFTAAGSGSIVVSSASYTYSN